ncbi:flagellar biosynthesis protein, partial [Klebsiella pneumoniae]|nr:flagellar biosynthesis protein [Klebsiella pneumoniae]
MAFDPPLGSSSPAVLLDNATRLDNLLNSLALVFPDRTGELLYTWRGIHQNLIPLSKQYMTLAAAQADIVNIP